MLQQVIQIQKEIPLRSFSSTKEWSKDYFLHTVDKNPIDSAIVGGFMVEQFSFAFMAGYQAALEEMFPTVAPRKIKALCVSEAGGVHPKSIQTTMVDAKMNGVKTYVTAGSEAEHLVILCNTNEQVEGRSLLKMVHLPASHEHMEIEDFELAFMQEVKHGKLRLHNTPIHPDQILEGDGYELYAKSFRTMEDIFVGVAYQAMLLRQAIEQAWEEGLRDSLLLNIHSLKQLKGLAPLDPETLLLVASCERQFERMLPNIEEHIDKHSSKEFQANWNQNKRVMFLAKKLKELRLAKARRRIFG